MREECKKCHLKTINRLIDKHGLSENDREVFLKEYQQFIVDEPGASNPYLATRVQRMARKFIGNDNLYKAEKVNANKVLLENYDQLRELVRKSDDPFEKAGRLAVAGNIIDYGAHTTPNDVFNTILELSKKPLRENNLQRLKQKLEKANSVLYLGDNAGEIVMDKLFIETINHPNLVYAVRGRPVLNDGTMFDAQFVGMNELCHVISNGYDAPSTLLDHCSSGFLYYFNNADVIIAKGMGNFEGLMDADRDQIFFMLMAKCEPIASLLNVQKGDMLVKEKTRVYETF